MEAPTQSPWHFYEPSDQGKGKDGEVLNTESEKNVPTVSSCPFYNEALSEASEKVHCSRELQIQAPGIRMDKKENH